MYIFFLGQALSEDIKAVIDRDPVTTVYDVLKTRIGVFMFYIFVSMLIRHGWTKCFNIFKISKHFVHALCES